MAVTFELQAMVSLVGAAVCYLLGRWAGVTVGVRRSEKQQWLKWQEQLWRSACCPLCGNSFSNEEDML